MELEIIMLNEISHAQKDKYHMIHSYLECKQVDLIEAKE
jgi:hypothetical protein